MALSGAGLRGLFCTEIGANPQANPGRVPIPVPRFNSSPTRAPSQGAKLVQICDFPVRDVDNGGPEPALPLP